jgi:Uma2 family endonuclease
MILGNRAEVQPDAALLIDPDHGGQVRIVDGMVHGGPELAVEIASSSEAYDLHGKLRDYERAGVREYVVFALRSAEIHWFVLADGRFVRREAESDKLYRSAVFPGLWLDPDAFSKLDYRRVFEVVQFGLADPGHAKFVERLQGGRL